MAVVSRPIEAAGIRGGRRVGRWASLTTIIVYGLALLAISVLLQRVLSEGQRRLDDLRYGMPRRAQTSVAMFAGDTQTSPTLIMTLNLNGQVSILVFPAGDTAKMQVLPGPYLVGRDAAETIALPTIRDVDGDGQRDLLVTIRDESLVYVNKEGKLRAITPEERAHLEIRGMP